MVVNYFFDWLAVLYGSSGDGAGGLVRRTPPSVSMMYLLDRTMDSGDPSIGVHWFVLIFMAMFSSGSFSCSELCSFWVLWGCNERRNFVSVDRVLIAQYSTFASSSIIKFWEKDRGMVGSESWNALEELRPIRWPILWNFRWRMTEHWKCVTGNS